MSGRIEFFAAREKLLAQLEVISRFQPEDLERSPEFAELEPDRRAQLAEGMRREEWLEAVLQFMQVVAPEVHERGLNAPGLRDLSDRKKQNALLLNPKGGNALTIREVLFRCGILGVIDFLNGAAGLSLADARKVCLGALHRAGRTEVKYSTLADGWREWADTLPLEAEANRRGATRAREARRNICEGLGRSLHDVSALPEARRRTLSVRWATNTIRDMCLSPQFQSDP
ncbi:hypothetical protein [Paracoccus ravus]|uniref:hypothetical protein n=1 Tax=Paracoccus ravus TaxID=2447760 RepID=UPI00106EB50C|nr:hypothetical protein [Paracoccus ravus]